MSTTDLVLYNVYICTFKCDLLTISNCKYDSCIFQF